MDPHLFDLNARMESTHWWFRARSEIIRELSGRVARSPVRVLEVGCGTGGILAALPESWFKIGVDPSEKAINAGRKNYPQLDLRCGIAPDDVRKEIAEANLVLICDVLEHVEDDRRLFSRIVEELSPGGQILLTVPADPKLWTNHDVTHGHFRRYTWTRLETLWESDPALEVRLFSPLNWRLYPIVKLVRLASRVRGKTLGSGDSDLFLPPGPVNAGLRSVFYSEHRALLERLDHSARPSRGKGVSWIVILRKRLLDKSSPPEQADINLKKERE